MLSNHDRLGPNGARITAVVDNLTLWRLDIIKERAKKLTNGTPFSAGAIVRRGVADLFERSKQWADLDQMDKLVERRLLEDAKKAKPQPDQDRGSYAAQVSSDEALTKAGK